MKYLISFTICFLFINLNAFAFGLNDFDKLQLQFGTWLENYQQVRANTKGDTNGFELTPYIGLGLEYKLKPQYLIIPEIGYVLQRTSEDVTKNHFFIRTDFAYLAKDWLKLRAGSSFMILSYAGEGGEDQLRNGNTTETYYIPEERRTAYNQTLDFGAEFIKDNMSLRLQNYIYAWNAPEERMLTYSISFSYLIPIKDL